MMSKSMGIFMDHANAHLIEFSAEPIESTLISSDFTHEVKIETLANSEYTMHNKEQQQQNAFYKKLGTAIKQYTNVLLFGPTNAKVELLNMLKEDQGFNNIKIDVKDSDKMTENQQYAFVKQHFENPNRI
jgi:stalled ribosome rescue protein Dom34